MYVESVALIASDSSVLSVNGTRLGALEVGFLESVGMDFAGAETGRGNCGNGGLALRGTTGRLNDEDIFVGGRIGIAIGSRMGERSVGAPMVVFSIFTV
jgi:hypothetical protein